MKPKIKKHIELIHRQIRSKEQFNPTVVAKKLSSIRSYDIGLFFSNLSKLKSQHLGEVLLELPAEAFSCAIKRIPPHKLAAAAANIESDEATDLIQYISSINDTLGKKVLSLLEPKDRSEIEELSKYSDEQAGSYMEREFLAAKPSQSVADIKQLVRNFRAKKPATPILKLFVVDENEKLIDSIHFTDIILYDDETKIEQIITELAHRSPLTIRAIAPINEVVRLFEEYDLNIIAVINKSGKLIGRIVYDDIYDMIRHIEMDQAYALAGVREESEERGLFNASKQRVVWLFVNLVTILLASSIIDQFDQTIASYVALAALLPVVAALGGNAGMQALTVTIRKLALGEIELEDTTQILKREVLIVLGNGLAVASVASLVVFIWFGNIMLSGVLALSLFATLIVAGIAGTLIPIGLNRAGIDPAVSSSIFLTTTTDILGFFIFLTLAEYLL